MIHTADLLHCVAETNATLQSSYPPIQIFFFFNETSHFCRIFSSYIQVCKCRCGERGELDLTSTGVLPDNNNKAKK